MLFFNHSIIRQLVALLLSITLATFVFSVVDSSLKASFKSQLVIDAQEALQLVDEISQDVVASLSLLNLSDATNCNEDVLLAMRRQTFLSKYVRDMGYLEGDYLICTTGLGLLATPVVDNGHDYIGPLGAQVWVNRELLLFEDNFEAIVVRLGRFNAVIDQQFTKTLLDKSVYWQFGYFKDDRRIVISEHNAPSTIAKDDILFSKQLYNGDGLYCMDIIATKAQYYRKNSQSRLAWRFSAILIGFIAWLLLNKAFRYLSSRQRRIQKGIKRRNFYCLYQPIIELNTGKIIGVEALARYKDGIGDLYPDQFIPAITKQGLTWPFTRLIAENIRDDLKTLTTSISGFKVNLNCFPQDVATSDILAISSTGLLNLNQFQFVIEITEDAKLDSKASISTLEKLRTWGLEIALDDFGTGYSNLRQIKELNCNTIKIDRSYVNDMEDGSIRSSLIPHVVSIASNMNANVVAEGIENAQQKQALIELGVEFGQGYMFSRPVTIERIQELLTSQAQSQKPLF